MGRRVPVQCEATIGEMHIPPSNCTTVDVHGVSSVPRAGTLASMATGKATEAGFPGLAWA